MRHRRAVTWATLLLNLGATYALAGAVLVRGGDAAACARLDPHGWYYPNPCVVVYSVGAPHGKVTP